MPKYRNATMVFEMCFKKWQANIISTAEITNPVSVFSGLKVLYTGHFNKFHLFYHKNVFLLILTYLSSTDTSRRLTWWLCFESK